MNVTFHSVPGGQELSSIELIIIFSFSFFSSPGGLSCLGEFYRWSGVLLVCWSPFLLTYLVNLVVKVHTSAWFDLDSQLVPT